MAIDSAEKRKAASAVVFVSGVTPNYLNGREWRFEVAGSYIGYISDIGSAVERRALSGIPLPLAPGVTMDLNHGRRWRYQVAYGTLNVPGIRHDDIGRVVRAWMKERRRRIKKGL